MAQMVGGACAGRKKVSISTTPQDYQNGIAVDLDWKHRGNLHGGEGGVVGGDRGEVVLQHGEGAGQRHVTTSAEQGHAAEAEYGGHQRGVGHPAQTLDAALEASCRGRQRAGSGLCRFQNPQGSGHI